MRQVALFDNHESQVWRVSWNVTGTILASSGDDGCIRMWKGMFIQINLCFNCHKLLKLLLMSSFMLICV